MKTAKHAKHANGEWKHLRPMDEGGAGAGGSAASLRRTLSSVRVFRGGFPLLS